MKTMKEKENKAEGEAQSRRVCSECKGLGHNRRTCPRARNDAKEEVEPHETKDEQQARSSGSKVVVWKTADLKVHPLNEASMPRLDGPSLERLHADVAVRGVDDPLHIVLDKDSKTGLVIAGRERFEAARAAGSEQVPVVVRHDLADDPVKLRLHVVLSNVDRKKLTEGQLVRALLQHEDHLLTERKLNDGGDAGDESAPDSRRVADIMADLVGVSATTWKLARRLVRAHEAGEAPIVWLYIDGVIRAHRADEAAKLAPAQQAEIVRQINEHADADRNERSRLVRTLIDEALQDQDEAAQAVQDDPEYDEREEGTAAPARNVATRSAGAKSKVIQFPREQVQDDVGDLDLSGASDETKESEPEDHNNALQPGEEVPGTSTPAPEASPIDMVRGALNDVLDLIEVYIERCPELRVTLVGVTKLRDGLPGTVSS